MVDEFTADPAHGVGPYVSVENQRSSRCSRETFQVISIILMGSPNDRKSRSRCIGDFQIVGMRPTCFVPGSPYKQSNITETISE